MTGNQVRLIAAMLISATLLAGCGMQPRPSQSGASTAQSVDPGQLLAQANSAQPLQAAQLRLQAAQLLRARGEKQQATQVLNGIDLNNLPPNLAFEITRLKASAAIESRDAGRALQYLNITQFPEFDASQRAEFSKLRAQAYDQQANPLSAAIELIAAARSAASNEQAVLNNQIWKQLQRVDTETLVAASFNGYGYYEQGWIELALSLKQGSDLAGKRDALAQWQQLWDAHPANQQPPEGLAALLNADIISAKRVLIALPFSGPLSEPARMISEGISAARYQRKLQGLPVPDLISADSTQFSSAADLLAYARNQNAELLIGPLDTQLIDQLSTMGQLPLPVIAFNQPQSNANNLYQLDLSSDQEIFQVVERAVAEGHQRFALITPAADWGQKLRDTYIEAINRQGVELVATLQYNNDAEYSGQVEQLLNTDRSRARFIEIRRILGQKMKFDERPRRDIDAILLTGQPAEARQIKPMLAFHFAGDYPVYASSHIYEGNAEPTRDIDLNGTQFPDLPWSMQSPSALHLQLANERGDTDSRLGRLYALGADAFTIYPFLHQLEVSSDLFFEGETGRLHLGAGKRIQRQLTWSQIRDGAPVLLGPAAMPEPAADAIAQQP